MSDDAAEKLIYLQVGDIIEIISPGDIQLNEKQFLIKYHDKEKIKLLGKLGETITININDDGSLRNESITGITLLSRAETASYARQNGLIKNQWIDIYFGGDVPAVMTGEIVELDEDQIEIKLIDGESIFIDFAYKGIPEDIPIEKIVNRDRPDGKQMSEKQTFELQKQDEEYDMQDDISDEKLPEAEPQFRERVKAILLTADQIQFGDKLGIVEMMVEVPEGERRYGIERQTTDLLNELLSNIPNAERSHNVINNIHKMIERFKQLRKEFSKFDVNGNITLPDIRGADYKPLAKSLELLNHKLYWILPVVKNTKKLYDIDEDVESMYSDVKQEIFADTRHVESELIDLFKQGRIPDGQNGYEYLTKRISSFWTPFTSPTKTEENTTIVTVQANIAAIVDNLEDFYSSVSQNESIKRKRFLIQEYNLGLNTLETRREKSGTSIIKLKNISQPDIATVKSFLTLPESVVAFSKINLPSTDILTKSNLSNNFISYWRLLNNSTNVTIKQITDKHIELDETTYLNDICEYIPSDIKLSFEEYIKKIVPKTRVLFNLLNKRIKNGFSMYEILSYLEPFMIYQKDISFKQYEEMNDYVNEKINDWKRLYLTNKKNYDSINLKSAAIAGPRLLNLFSVNIPIKSDIEDGYRLNSLPIKSVSDGELLKLFNDLDCGKFFNSSLSILSSDLMIPLKSLDILNEDKKFQKAYKTQISSAAQETCEKRILTKKYTSKDLLIADNDRDIKFDKKYDKTYYDIINNYLKELDIITGQPAKIKFLSRKLQESVGMSIKTSERESEALLLGYKPVKEGDYAVLVINEISSFYIRKNNSWVRDESVLENTQIEENSLFCNLSDKCIALNDKCETISKLALDIQKNAISKMVAEFDESYSESKEELNEKIQSIVKNSYTHLTSLNRIKNDTLFRFDSKMYSYGLEAKEVFVIQSPYAKILSLIVNQGDFIKRQNDISKFATYYTRPAEGPSEDEWWLYCIATGAKLLPTFLSKLANIFVKGEDYFGALQVLMSQQGVEGGDGEAVIDKHTGWVMTNIDFNTEEGYSEEGFVIKTRDVLKPELGKEIIQAPGENPEKFGDPETEKIARVIRAISKSIGLNTESLEEFVISETTKLLSKSMPPKEEYERALAADKGKKKKETYEIVYDRTLIIITSAFLLIGIQTSIPSLRTRKTYPGCIKSFSGYPAFGDGDKRGIQYIACVINKISSSIEPWNSVKSLTPANLVTKMEAFITKFIFPTYSIQERIKLKIKYDETNTDVYIPEVHDITNWINFLPPLKPIIVKVEPPTKEFKDLFLTNIKKGDKDQFSKINALRSKIIFLSLSIENAIQKVVNSNISANGAILSNNSRIPFLENACCNDTNDDTYTYFITREPSIGIDNTIIREIRDVIKDVMLMARAPFLFNHLDTSTKYPLMPSEFDEFTIYKAFIVYCKYNSKLPISEEIRAICMDRPVDFNNADSTEEKITKLKKAGKNFDNESLTRLMTIINRNNIVLIPRKTFAINSVVKLRDLLELLNEVKNPILPPIFIGKFIKMINHFDTVEKADDKEPIIVREMKNYLKLSGDALIGSISEFVRRNTNVKIYKPFIECLNQITDFKPINDNSELEIFNMVSFMKNILNLIICVYPNMIINHVKYDKIPIPLHWDLSEVHSSDLRNHASEHFKALSQFYDDETIKRIMEVFHLEGTQLFKISMETIYLSSNNSESNGDIIRIFDKKMIQLLFRFYILNTLSLLIDLIGRDEFYEEQFERPSNPLLVANIEKDDVSRLAEDVAPLVEMMSGDKKHMSEKMARLIAVFMGISCKDKKSVDMTYEELMDKVTRGKEKEKDMIVEFLTEMTDAEREIENQFKNFRIGRWSVGMQKGFRQYDGDTYDQEREAIEKRTILETKLKKVDGVTEGLMDMFALNAISDELESEIIEKEELTIEYNGEDDNIADDTYENEM